MRSVRCKVRTLWSDDSGKIVSSTNPTPPTCLSSFTTISKTKSKGEGTVTVLLSRPAFGMDLPNSEVVEPVCLHYIGFHLYITLLLWCLTRKAGIRPASKSTAFEMEFSAWTILKIFLYNTFSGLASLCDCILHFTKIILFYFAMSTITWYNRHCKSLQNRDCILGSVPAMLQSRLKSTAVHFRECPHCCLLYTSPSPRDS